MTFHTFEILLINTSFNTYFAFKHDKVCSSIKNTDKMHLQSSTSRPHVTSIKKYSSSSRRENSYSFSIKFKDARLLYDYNFSSMRLLTEISPDHDVCIEQRMMLNSEPSQGESVVRRLSILCPKFSFYFVICRLLLTDARVVIILLSDSSLLNLIKSIRNEMVRLLLKI